MGYTLSQFTIFLIGLFPLIYFSVIDLKNSKVSNGKIYYYLCIGLGILFGNGQFILQFSLIFFWIILGFIMWYMETIGGADYKILIINSIFLTLIFPNAIAGHFLFIMLLGINGIFYGIIAKLIQRKQQIPFIPVITLTYILSFIFWTIK